MVTMGVLALQSAVSEHLQVLKRLQVQGVAVKQAADLEGIDALIILGGVSTAISCIIDK